MLFRLALCAVPLLVAATPAKRPQVAFGGSDSNSLSLPTAALPAFEWLTAEEIKPSLHSTYSLSELQRAAQATFGEDAVWHCLQGALTAVFFSDETTMKSSCPDFGIKWLPDFKHSDIGFAEPPTGEIIIEVVNATTGVKTGCLGEGMMWTLGACGAFNVTSFNETTPVNSTYWMSTPNNFTLTGIKGPCGAEKGVFACKALAVASFFQVDLDTSFLIFNGTADFYSPFAPMGPWMKLPILTAGKLGMVNVSLTFSPAPPAPPAF